MKEYCFGTLAVGKEYQSLALLLAKDLEIYAPETKLVIVTNNPKYFNKQCNVLAYKYQGNSVKIYNDKRLVIEKALSMYNTCIFLDADIRIGQKVPADLEFPPGILAFSCWSLFKFMNRKNDQPNIVNKEYWLRQEIITKVSNYWQINLEKSKFVQDFAFIITKNEKYDHFIKTWEIIAGYLELKGIYAGAGFIIGLAAAHTGFAINYDYEKKIKFFKDRLTLEKIRKEQEVNEQELQFLEERKSISYSHNIFVKINKKLKSKLVFWIRLLSLKITTLKYQEIYRCFDSKG
ncbi:hypothetical protein [Dapis sp. BLCC M172]|uniref:hypothetical protein n=1 Tax=Dapis sp. BLCC M172 TaxID=2975281 RepID=UPI003CEF8C34